MNDAKVGLEKYFRLHNQDRPHSSLDDKTPDEFYFEKISDLDRKQTRRLFLGVHAPCCKTLYFFSRSRSRLSSAMGSSSNWTPLFTINPSLACFRQRDIMKGWTKAQLLVVRGNEGLGRIFMDTKIVPLSVFEPSSFFGT